VVFLSLQAKQLKGEMPEIIAATTRSAFVATLLLAAVLAAGTLPGAVWFFPLAAAAYLLAGQLTGAWDLRAFLGARFHPVDNVIGDPNR
jgi:hypothetical protein